MQNQVEQDLDEFQHSDQFKERARHDVFLMSEGDEKRRTIEKFIKSIKEEWDLKVSYTSAARALTCGSSVGTCSCPVTLAPNHCSAAQVEQWEGAEAEVFTDDKTYQRELSGLLDMQRDTALKKELWLVNRELNLYDAADLSLKVRE